METNASCTIYNRYVVSGAEVYQRSQIVAVKWENRKAANIIKSGLLQADGVVIYVQKIRIASRYVPPMAWHTLANKTGFITFQPGDYLVKGLVTDEIAVGFSLTDLRAKYDDVVKITTIDRLDSGSLALHHFQIGAS